MKHKFLFELGDIVKLQNPLGEQASEDFKTSNFYIIIDKKILINSDTKPLYDIINISKGTKTINFPEDLLEKSEAKVYDPEDIERFLNSEGISHFLLYKLHGYLKKYNK